jgi:hypothetical protein
MTSPSTAATDISSDVCLKHPIEDTSMGAHGKQQKINTYKTMSVRISARCVESRRLSLAPPAIMSFCMSVGVLRTAVSAASRSLGLNYL